LRSLTLRHVFLGEVEDFLAEKLEDVQDVLALTLALTCGLADVRDEVVPVDHPLLLDDADKGRIEFRQQVLMLSL
jgi:hypothetical protein